MPRTTGEKIAFSLLMSYVMAFGMEFYNTALRVGHLGLDLLPTVAGEVWYVGFIVVAVSELIAGPPARRVAFSVVTPGRARPVAVKLAVSLCTVALMCPLMSLVRAVVCRTRATEPLAEQD